MAASRRFAVVAAVAGWLVIVGLLAANLVVQRKMLEEVRDTNVVASNAADSGSVAQLSSEVEQLRQRLDLDADPTPGADATPQTPPAAAP